jgi:hypothetical protein
VLGLGTGSGSHRHTGDSSVHLRHALLHPDLASASLELPGCLLTMGSVASSGLFVLLDIFSRGLWHVAPITLSHFTQRGGGGVGCSPLGSTSSLDFIPPSTPSLSSILTLLNS